LEVDKDRLVKLLNMTESQHDGEALAAIRKSNDLLRLSRASWSDVLGVSAPPVEEPRQPEPPKPSAASRSSARPQQTARAASTAWQPEYPPGYERARDYRNAFRREPFVPRVLGFPFWIIVEFLALVAPRKYVNINGPVMTAVFMISMLLGILAWIGLGYYLVFEV
jgi:hypothetical protein